MNAGTISLAHRPEPEHNRRGSWTRKLLAFFFIAAACYMFFQSQAYSGPKQLNLQAIQFRNLDGSTFDTSSLRGKTLILNFWAPWCSPCRREMPWLENLHQNHPEVTLLGIEADRDQYRNASLMEGRSQISYPLVQFTPSLETAIGPIHSLPTTLYISRSGQVVHAVAGIVPEMVMEHYLRSAMIAR